MTIKSRRQNLLARLRNLAFKMREVAHDIERITYAERKESPLVDHAIELRASADEVGDWIREISDINTTKPTTNGIHPKNQ